jgi:hypothetical protein
MELGIQPDPRTRYSVCEGLNVDDMHQSALHGTIMRALLTELGRSGSSDIRLACVLDARVRMRVEERPAGHYVAPHDDECSELVAIGDAVLLVEHGSGIHLVLLSEVRRLGLAGARAIPVPEAICERPGWVSLSGS